MYCFLFNYCNINLELDTVGSFTGGMFESVPEEVFPVPRLSIQTKSCPEHSTSAVVSYWYGLFS